MDWSIKDMDFLIKHWGSYPRRFPSLFALGTIAPLFQKRYWVRHEFTACNFSLILRGRGEYFGFGRRWEVEAPCVITQWPGEFLEYGPTGPDGTWDEVYMIYDAAMYPIFVEHRLIDRGRPIWPILNVPAVQAQLMYIEGLCSSPDPTQTVDRVDRACEQLILETLLPLSGCATAPTDLAMIRDIERELAVRLGEEVDIDAIAARWEVSPATFRRRWAQVNRVPPARYRLQLRLREACRLLTETNQPIYEIARRVGFADEFYFSRCFRRELKLAPRNYRRAFQVNRA